jgi:hypothetical protein
MATKYSMEICDAETGEYTPVALFSDIVPAEVLHELCVTLFENTEGASTVLCVDMDTGEVVAEAAIDMGFDPYLECYTDDC